MRIGIVRHFDVDCLHKNMLSSEEFQQWVNKYDASPIRRSDMPVNSYSWEKCYCSNLPRAIKTAQHIYQGVVTESALLREVPIAPMFSTKMKLPYIFWLIAGRIAWRFSHPSQPETLKQTRDRVQQFVAEFILKSKASTLIVTHGFLMTLIQKELKAKGFVGDSFKRAKHGKVYLIESKK